jgi:hypothetical protein
MGGCNGVQGLLVLIGRNATLVQIYSGSEKSRVIIGLL